MTELKKLLNEIEQLRSEMYELIILHDDLLAPEVIAASMALDVVILKYNRLIVNH